MAAVAMVCMCPVCGKKVKNSQMGIGCERKCGRWFHTHCVKLSKEKYAELSKDNTLTWSCFCDDCQPPFDFKAFEDLMSDFHKKFDVTVKELRKENEEVRKAADFMNVCFEQVKKELVEIKNGVDLKFQNVEGVASLQSDLNEIQQYQRRNNLIISGIPQSKQETVNDIILKIAQALGVELDVKDIDFAHRLPFKRDGSAFVRDSPILVRFINRWKKDEILRVKFSKRRISTVDLGLEGPDLSIYLNDHLTPQGDALAKRTRDLRRAGKIVGAWTRDCKVFIREKQFGPAVRIMNLNQLREIEIKLDVVSE